MQDLRPKYETWYLSLGSDYGRDAYSDAVVVFFSSAIFKLKAVRFIYPFPLRQYEQFTPHSRKRASFNVTHLVFFHCCHRDRPRARQLTWRTSCPLNEEKNYFDSPSIASLLVAFTDESRICRFAR